jgi:hypothetical protein
VNEILGGMIHRLARNRDTMWVVLGVMLAVLPMVLPVAWRTFSCGHDLPFHLGSWHDAQQQIRHGSYPQWDYEAAHGAGEPRFVFYPPLSWLLGVALSFLVQGPAASNLFIAVAFVCCWTTMYWTASQSGSRAAAMVAASVYAASPYVVYDALQRSALGELLACAWLPLIFAAMLGARVRVRLLAATVALLCLTNIPVTVMGIYLIVLLALLRLVPALRPEGGCKSGGMDVVSAAVGIGLGVALAGFFLVPALYQRHQVQLGAAFGPGQRFSDNFLLWHTADTRRGAIHSASLLVAEYGGALLLLWVGLYFGKRFREVRVGAVICAVVLVMMLPVSTGVWRHAPALDVLQFPWRLIAILCAVLSLTLSAALAKMERPVTGAMTAILAAWILMGWGAHQYWVSAGGRDEQDIPRVQAVAETERRPTLEYTPVDAPQALEGRDIPPFWIVAAPAPLRFDSRGRGDVAAAGSDAVTPSHLDVHTAEPAWLVLKTRDYPRWEIYKNGEKTDMPHTSFMGHMAVRLDAGESSIDVKWKEGADEIVGFAVTLAALGCFQFMRSAYGRGAIHGFLKRSTL